MSITEITVNNQEAMQDFLSFILFFKKKLHVFVCIFSPHLSRFWHPATRLCFLLHSLKRLRNTLLYKLKESWGVHIYLV